MGMAKRVDLDRERPKLGGEETSAQERDREVSPFRDEPDIEAVQQGDRLAFADFVRREDRWLKGVIYGVLSDRDRVDDVSQKVWTSVWQRIGKLRDVQRWRPWVYRMARNAAVDAGRETTRRRQLNLSARAEAQASSRRPHVGPEREIIENEKHRAVLAAVEALPVLYREPFVMRHLNGWSYQQIANAMDMPADSVETRLVRARRILRESLKGKVE